MPESQCIRVKLRPGKTEEFLRWAKTLSSRDNEVHDALRTEEILAENIFLERSAAGDFILFYTKAKNLLRANQIFASSVHPLDVEAKAVIASTWDLSTLQRLELVVDL